MLHPLVRRCILSDVDPDCRAHGLQELVEVLSRKLVNDSSDVTGLDEVKKAANLFIDALNAIRARRHFDD